MRVVSILNQKGGVAKTTTAVNLGAALALAGRRVLLIDIDPQANLSDHLGVDAEARGTTVYDVLTDGAPISEGIVPTGTPGLFVLPADGDLAAAEQELASEIAREMRLQQALSAADVTTPEGGAFDWVLIDCPPSLGLLSLNAMAASDDVLVTVQTEYFAMRGLGQIDQIVAMVRQHVNARLNLLGVLPTLVNPVTRLAREVIEEIRAHYGDIVFETRIRLNVRLAEAPGHQQHIFDYDPHSAGAEDYAALAREVERRRHGEAAPREAAPREAAPEAASDEPPAADTRVDTPAEAGGGETPEAATDEARREPTAPQDAAAAPDSVPDAAAVDDNPADEPADEPAAPVLQPVVPPAESETRRE